MACTIDALGVFDFEAMMALIARMLMCFFRVSFVLFRVALDVRTRYSYVCSLNINRTTERNNATDQPTMAEATMAINVPNDRSRANMFFY